MSVKLLPFRLNITNAGIHKEYFTENLLESWRVAILGWLLLKHELHLLHITWSGTETGFWGVTYTSGINAFLLKKVDH